MTEKPEQEVQNEQNWKRMCRLVVESILRSNGTWSEHYEANK
jgi:hypothetical protein